MILPMRKIHLAARQTDREQLLSALSDLGVVHLVPADAEKAVADESSQRRLDALRQAMQILSGVEPVGDSAQITPVEAAHEVLEIQRRATEERNHLAALYHQLEQIAVWDGLRFEHVAELREAGVEVRFYEVPPHLVDQVRGECTAEVAELPSRRVFMAVADRTGGISVPDEAEPMPLPSRDAATIRAEAKQTDAALHRDVARLHELAHLSPAMATESLRLEQEIERAVAVGGAVADEALFAVQGWLPQENLASLDEQLAEQGLPFALEELEPSEGEQPPTLVRPPAWARPIEGLFKILGTVPGYREFDVSIPFMIALPIFTAMLISDAGYGALLLLGPALAYPKVAKVMGARFTQLLMFVGAVSVAWGVLTNAFFGFAVLPVTLIPIELTEASRLYMMKLSFTIGAIHLSLAQTWQAVRYFPDLRCVNKLGWALFVWGMYGVVNMFVLKTAMGWGTPWPYLLLVGAALAILFASPSRNPVKMIGVGVAQFPLSMLSAFSDVISYVRLMAVGLASSVLAVSFNEMALDAGFWPLTALILLFGHGLNLGLAMIAMFAHGVRLNMLEFCNNLGMQWAGYPYKPFARRTP